MSNLAQRLFPRLRPGRLLMKSSAIWHFVQIKEPLHFVCPSFILFTGIFFIFFFLLSMTSPSLLLNLSRCIIKTCVFFSLSFDVAVQVYNCHIYIDFYLIHIIRSVFLLSNPTFVLWRVFQNGVVDSLRAQETFCVGW